MNSVQIAIISARYRREITDVMEKNCIETLIANGIKKENIQVTPIPGALEVGLVAKKLAETQKFAAIIAFGCVLKGDTYHFEQIANESVRGCMKVSYEYEIPVIYEILTVYDMKHAHVRAVSRGQEGASAALAMIKLLNTFS